MKAMCAFFLCFQIGRVYSLSSKENKYQFVNRAYVFLSEPLSGKGKVHAEKKHINET